MTATHEARAPARPQVKRAMWDISPELRDSVMADLREWGVAQRGAMPDLGYPHEQPFSVSPSRPSPNYSPEKVDAITDTMTMWRLIIRECADYETGAHLIRLLQVIRSHFITDAPAESQARKFRVSRRTFWRLVDEACYRFWILHY